MKLAYLSQGKLYIRNGGGAPQPVESQFAQDIVNRALAQQQKNSWKTGGTSAAAMVARQSMAEYDPRAINVRIAAVAPGNNVDEIFYVVASSGVGGVFSYNLATGKETRIFHKENLVVSDFARDHNKDRFACSQRSHMGTASISICQGNDIIQVTEGDSADESPAWVQAKDNQLVYQSAGIARNQSGMPVGLGPASIQKLDLSTGTVTTLLEEENTDFLSPSMTASGELFYIKRPFEPLFKRSYPWYKLLLDCILLPFRLARALFDFLNFMSLTFSKKPLTTAGGPKLEGPDEKALLLRGKMIQAQQLDKQVEEDALHLVPKTWQLVRRDVVGHDSIVADGVLAYALAPEDKIVYSTGAAIYQCDVDGKNRTLLSKDKFVETLVVLRAEVTGSTDRR